MSSYDTTISIKSRGLKCYSTGQELMFGSQDSNEGLSKSIIRQNNYNSHVYFCVMLWRSAILISVC